MAKAARSLEGMHPRPRWDELLFYSQGTFRRAVRQSTVQAKMSRAFQGQKTKFNIDFLFIPKPSCQTDKVMHDRIFKGMPLLDVEYLRIDTRQARGYYRPLTESDMPAHDELDRGLKIISVILYSSLFTICL